MRDLQGTFKRFSYYFNLQTSCFSSDIPSHFSSWCCKNFHQLVLGGYHWRLLFWLKMELLFDGFDFFGFLFQRVINFSVAGYWSPFWVTFYCHDYRSVLSNNLNHRVIKCFPSYYWEFYKALSRKLDIFYFFEFHGFQIVQSTKAALICLMKEFKTKTLQFNYRKPPQ